MRVLAIDTSLRSSGFAVVEDKCNNISILDCGIIKNKAILRHSECLMRLSNALQQLIHQFQPDEMAIESPFFSCNAKTAMILGMAKGVVVVSAEKFQLPIYEYAPKKAKKVIVGNGNASKQQVAIMVAGMLNVDISEINDDATDAMAIGLCHLRQRYHLFTPSIIL